MTPSASNRPRDGLWLRVLSCLGAAVAGSIVAVLFVFSAAALITLRMPTLELLALAIGLFAIATWQGIVIHDALRRDASLPRPRPRR